MQHLIHYHSDRPNIIFNCVYVSLKSLRTHIERRADINSFLRIRPGSLGKAEISNLNGFVFEEDVGRFEVAMQEAIFRNMYESHHNLAYERESFLF